MDKTVIVTHAMMVMKLWEVVLLKHQQSQGLPVYFSKSLYILHMILTHQFFLLGHTTFCNEVVLFAIPRICQVVHSIVIRSTKETLSLQHTTRVILCGSTCRSVQHNAVCMFSIMCALMLIGCAGGMVAAIGRS